MYMKNVKSFDIVDFSMHYAYNVPNNAFDRRMPFKKRKVLYDEHETKIKSMKSFTDMCVSFG